MSRLSRKCGILDVLKPYGLLQKELYLRYETCYLSGTCVDHTVNIPLLILKLVIVYMLSWNIHEHEKQLIAQSP
jgi:hypothetical protein